MFELLPCSFKHRFLIIFKRLRILVKADMFHLQEHHTILLFPDYEENFPLQAIVHRFDSAYFLLTASRLKCQASVLWSASKSAQRAAKSLVFKMFLFTKFKNTDYQIQHFHRSCRRVLIAKACLWLIQWVPVMAWLFLLINVMNAVHEPSIAGAPLVQTPTSFSQERYLSWEKSETVVKPSEAFGVVSSTFKKSIFLSHLNHPQTKNSWAPDSTELHQWWCYWLY